MASSHAGVVAPGLAIGCRACDARSLAGQMQARRPEEPRILAERLQSSRKEVPPGQHQTQSDARGLRQATHAIQDRAIGPWKVSCVDGYRNSVKESSFLSTQSANPSTESCFLSTESTSLSTESSFRSTESTNLSTGSSFLSTEGANLSTVPSGPRKAQICPRKVSSCPRKAQFCPREVPSRSMGKASHRSGTS